jgi:hypothetical protein
MVASKTPVDAGAPAQAIYKKFEVPPTASFRRFEEERVLTEFKESVVETWNVPGRLSDPGADEALRNAPGRPFEMPDGYNQLFSSERFKVSEGLFNASAALHVCNCLSSSKSIVLIYNIRTPTTHVPRTSRLSLAWYRLLSSTSTLISAHSS